MLEEQLELLSNIILAKLGEEFAVKHLSGNLLRTIRVEKMSDEINIYIPAEIYDMLEYKRRGVVIPTGEGSYASKIDEEGSSYRIGNKEYSPRNHIGYVNKIIDSSLQEWTKMLQSIGEIKVEG